MEELVYRVRRISDGKWYGDKPRFTPHDDRDAYWRPIRGRYFSLAGLKALRGSFCKVHLADIEVISYRLEEISRQSAMEAFG